MSSRLLSVIIPNYNNELTIKKTIDSILKSTYKDIEIIIIDDCSTTAFISEIANEFGSRVLLIRNEVNLGISGNFNKAFLVCETPFLQILGQDDILVKSLLPIINESLSNIGNAFGIHPSVNVIDEYDKRSFGLIDIAKFCIRPKKQGVISPKSLRRSLLIGNWCYFPAIIWYKPNITFSPFSLHLNYCQDLDLMLKLSNEQYGIVVSQERSLGYRRHKDSASMSASINDRYIEELMVIRSHKTTNFVDLMLIKLALFPRLNYIFKYLFS
jgi:glycosyltransferase involved in cell wall biosynthesis